MILWKTSLFCILCISLVVSAGKWKKEFDFNSQKISQLLRQGFTLTCADCSTLQYILPGATSPTTIICPEGQFCGPIDGGFNCIAADSPDASECSCGGAENTFIIDPYNPMIYYACLPGGDQVIQECADDQIYTGNHTAPCVDLPECLDTGFSKDTCIRYHFCEKAGAVPTILTCEEGTVWDEVNFGCVDPCSLAPEEFTCDGKVDGAYPDTITCAKFHLCFFGTHIEQDCPGDKQYFDTTDDSCKDDESVKCPKTDLCYDKYKNTCTVTSETDSTTTLQSSESSTTTKKSTTETIKTTPTTEQTTLGTTLQSSESSTTTKISSTETIKTTPTTEQTTLGTSDSTKASADSTITTTTIIIDTTTSESTVDPSDSDVFTCDGKAEGAHPDPCDCSIYHICFIGTHNTLPCPDDEPFYNTATNGCDVTDPGTCPDTCTTPTTVSTTDTSDSSATPTTKVSTESTVTTINTRTTTTASSESTTDSTKSSTDTGETTTESSVPDCSKATEQGYFTNKESCKEFHACESDDAGGFVLKNYSCPGDLVFDPVNQYCNLVNLVPSCGGATPTVASPTLDPTSDSTTDSTSDSTYDSTTSDSTTPDIDCGKVTSQTYFPNEENCNLFASCESDDAGGFVLKEYSCPGPLVFDPVNQYCNLLNLVPSCQ